MRNIREKKTQMKRKWMGKKAIGVVGCYAFFFSFCSNPIEMNNEEIPMGIDMCVRVVVGSQQKSQWKGHCE